MKKRRRTPSSSSNNSSNRDGARCFCARAGSSSPASLDGGEGLTGELIEKKEGVEPCHATVCVCERELRCRIGEGGGPRTTSIGDRGGAVVRGEGHAAAEARGLCCAAPKDGCSPNLPRDFIVNLDPPLAVGNSGSV